MKHIIYASKDIIKKLQSFNLEKIEFIPFESRPHELRSYFKATSSKFTDFLFKEFLMIDHKTNTKLLRYTESHPSCLLDKYENFIEMGDSEEGLEELGLEYIDSHGDQTRGFVAQKNWENAQRCFFLDRDGILIKESPYIFEIEKAEIKYDVLDLLKKFQKNGWKLVVVTNQSGIAREYFSESDFNKFTMQLDKKIKEYGVIISDWVYCPFHKEGSSRKHKRSSYLRKPFPGMVYKAQYRNAIELNGSIMIGDQLSDHLYENRLRYFHLESNKPLLNAGSEVFENISSFESHALDLGLI